MTTALVSRVSRLEKTSAGVLAPADIAGLWTPRSDPQRLALESEADELYYGGAASGGKTDLLIGAALTQHRHAVLFRREYAQHSAIIDRVMEVLVPIADQVAYNGTELRWRLPGSRFLELGAAQHEDSVRKWRGRPHDGKFFDELPEFTEAQHLFFSGWARTTIPGQRVRTIGAGNPPTDTDGEWVISRWGPWLDEQHPYPALPGELRWFVRIEGKDTEVEGPEPLRSQLLYGDHAIGLQDDEWQVNPSAWVREAQVRWTPQRPEGAWLEQIGADIAQGGADNTVLARRYGNWFAEPEVHPGIAVPDARHNAEHVGRALVEGGTAVIDVDGVGASTYHLLAVGEDRERVVPYRGSQRIPTLRDRSGRLAFANQRAAAWWALRDALDPAHGSVIALPPSRELRADLCSVRWTRQVSGIQLEDKEDVRKRIGRSPDLGDAYVMANARWLQARPAFRVGQVTWGGGSTREREDAFERLRRMPEPVPVRPLVGRRR